MVDRYDEELFLEYVEGELPVDKRLAFENQMLQDPRLRNLVAQMVLDRHRMRTLPDEAPPDHLMDAVHERLERAMLLGASPQDFAQSKPLAIKGFRWRRFATMGAMAAMVAVVAGVFVVTLVQLANDTPIRNVGPGSLFPPGMLPPSLVPAKPNIAGTSPSTDTSPSDAGSPSTGTSADPTVKQPTPPTLALVPPALPDVTPDVTPEVAPTSKPPVKPNVTTPAPLERATDDGQLSIEPLPEASLVFAVTTRDIPAARRRLTAWITAYQATELDTRAFESVDTKAVPDHQAPDVSFDDAASTDKPAAAVTLDAATSASTPAETAPTANQAITLDDQKPQSPAVSNPGGLPRPAPLVTRVPSQAPVQVTPPATQAGLMVTLALPDEQLISLEMFLTTLPDAQVHKTPADKIQSTPISSDTASSATPPQQPASDIQTQPFVLTPRADTPLPSVNASTLAEPVGIQQWLGSILPDWLLDAEPAPASGQTIVRVEFIPE